VAISEVGFSLGTVSSRQSLKVRQDVLQKIKKQVRLYLGEESQGLRRYALAYKKDIERSRWKPVVEKDFLARLDECRIVVGGDFHAYSQAQRVHLRHLRHLILKSPLILAVECIESRHQKSLDDYIQGRIAEEVFLKKVKWHSSWGFSWESYKPLFDLIREHRGRCIALNLKRSSDYQGLRARDKHAAQIIAETYLSSRKNEKIYVIYGDLHIAQDHLPLEIRKKTKNKVQIATLYLNPEKIYFQLFKKNIENQINIVRFSQDQFCLIESPPWVKWQSYLIFLEETLDFSIDEGQDYSEHIHSLIHIMASDLGLKMKPEVNIYSFKDHDFLDRLEESLDPRSFVQVQFFIENDFNFFDLKTQRGYLARGTVNYAAHLAGHIFHVLCSQSQKINLKFPDEFEKAIWFEAFSFFLSKLINPHRKSLSMGDLKKQLAAFLPQDQGESAFKLALDQKMQELLWCYQEDSIVKQQTTVRKAIPSGIYYNAGKILGSMLGEKIYRIYKTGRLSRQILLDWLQTPVHQIHFRKFYIQVLRELDKLDSGDAKNV
jgi:uncharacterized iron-regulated protein